jgi:hypothetical protein
VWFSQPTYFEPLVKKEKLDIILRLTKKEGEHLAFNPGIKFVGDIEDMQKKYSLSGFISVYIRMIEKKEKEEIPWSICLKPMVTYDRSKKSTSFSVGIIFLGDFSPKIF